jgi:protein-disulfide isomerase
LCFIAGMALMWGVDRRAGGRSASGDIKRDAFAGGAWNHEAAAVPISSKDPSWGSPEALVTIVEFSDFECPYCGRVEPTIDALKQKYGPEKLRVVWKHNPLPFHKNATPAHAASEAVFQLGGSQAFWKFHALAFQNRSALTPENFVAWAGQSGVDGAKFKAAFEADKAKYEAKVNADLEVGKKVGVRGTPAFLINGVLLSGAQPQPKFEEEIDKQLAEAQKLVAAGTPKGEVYVKLTNQNKAKVPTGQEAAERKQPEEDKSIWRVPVGENDPVKGPKHALVTIVEFSEFQCPFCKRVLDTTKAVAEAYGDKVRFVWKDNPLPFHNRAVATAVFAREALAQKGVKGFWEAHDILFENQRELEDDHLAKYADKIGIDMAKVKSSIESKKYQEIFDASQELASDLNAGGTPHFFVNGRRLVGAQPLEKFKEVIDEQLKKAEELVGKGTKLEALYDELMKEGKEPPPPETKEVAEAPKDAPWKGAKDAKVVIQEFSDFECPFCSRVEGTMKELMTAYGDRVKVVWRHNPLPFHQAAGPAHQASIEAYVQKGNDGFWAMHEKMFAGQKEPGLKREALEKYAQEIGLDMDKFKKALDGNTHKARMDADLEAGKAAGIQGTPSFVIGRYYLSGAQPFAKFKKLVDRALKEAKK